ncbi:MAG: DUF2177 family protein [Chloroflexi bacterium]|nr:DUF2177 family protein [Chloroflexota bacterium]
MGETAIAAITVLAAMGVADAVWLTTMTNRFYRRELPGLLAETPQWAPALGFYLLYAVGTIILVVQPALDQEYSLARVAGTGALLGLVAYGTYDLTNLATVKNWSVRVTVVDMVWGAALTAASAVLAVVAARGLA